MGLIDDLKAFLDNYGKEAGQPEDAKPENGGLSAENATETKVEATPATTLAEEAPQAVTPEVKAETAPEVKPEPVMPAGLSDADIARIAEAMAAKMPKPVAIPAVQRDRGASHDSQAQRQATVVDVVTRAMEKEGYKYNAERKNLFTKYPNSPAVQNMQLQGIGT